MQPGLHNIRVLNDISFVGIELNGIKDYTAYVVEDWC